MQDPTTTTKTNSPWRKGATTYHPAYTVKKGEYELSDTPGFESMGAAISAAADCVVMNVAKGLNNDRGVPVIVSTYHKKPVARFDVTRGRWMINWGTGVPACSCQKPVEPKYALDKVRTWDHEPYCVLAAIEFAAVTSFPMSSRGKYFSVALDMMLADWTKRTDERATHDGTWTAKFTHFWTLMGYLPVHQFPYQWGMVELYEPPT